ncbi:pyruvate, water dikinase regulatory protein [Carnobacterium divergens]|uniref:pyruvate, water dikinase regulatory protein n=1 Tax=Carnobacterium divergens TaxID=2748 RepID=UPI0039AEEE36
MSKQPIIYILSDSIGETAQKVVSAVLVQFPELKLTDIRRYPFIEDEKMLLDILNEVLKENGIIVHTLVSKKFVRLVVDFCKETGLSYVDVMSPLTRVLHAKTGTSPLEEPGALHKLDEHYFSRVSAIEFAVKYDDGKDPRSFLLADFVLLGVSRTSKTPLSMYLANNNFKVANLPIIPEAAVPKELFEIDPAKIIGLTSSAHSLMKIRKLRLRTLGLNEDASYSSETRIAEELAFANELYQQLGIQVIDVEHRAIEETAALICALT